MERTCEGAPQHLHSLDHCVEFFSKAGSIYDTPKRKTFYENSEDILDLFVDAWVHDKETTFKLLLWVRDARGGSGNRSGFRKCLKWLAVNDTKWVLNNIEWIPEVGRWDDLRTLFGTPCQDIAVALWFKAILLDKNSLAAKWAKRTDIPLYLEFKRYSHGKVNMGNFRRFLAGNRNVVETKMCKREWNGIEYSNVPSVAMARYTNAFNKHDEDGMLKFKGDLESGETTINASVLFPHDCVRTSLNGDTVIADAQFDALPNYMETDENIIVLCDTSGSMETNIGGSVEAVHVSTGLALYCSGKMPKESPFHKKFIQFESESKYSDWNGMSFSQALQSGSIFNGAVASTRIDKALDLILSTANMFKVSDDNMPKMLLICSDMQFTDATREGYYGYHDNNKDTKETLTEVEISLQKWDDAGYSRPKVVYWNLVPYGGQPDTVNSKDIALVSGFSPSILKSILECGDFSPRAVMLKALEKYENVVSPEQKDET